MHCIREPGQILSKIKALAFLRCEGWSSHKALITAIRMTICALVRRIVALLFVFICHVRACVFVTAEAGV